jgi:hypothetical protein
MLILTLQAKEQHNILHRGGIGISVDCAGDFQKIHLASRID